MSKMKKIIKGRVVVKAPAIYKLYAKLLIWLIPGC